MQQASPASNTVRLPRSVVRQAQQADARLKELQQQGEPGTESPMATPTPPAPEPSVAAVPPTGPQPPKDNATDPRHSDPLYWKQRFEVMNGILTRERQQHAELVEGLHQKIDELEGQVATLKATPQPSSSKVDIGKYFTPEVIERIGEEEATSIAAAAEKAAQDAANAAVERVAAMLKPEQNRRERQAVDDLQTKKREYKEALLAEFPDFDEMDRAEDWLLYLNSPYGKTPFLRQQILDRYIAAFDTPKTIEFIKEFLETRNTPAPPIAPQGDGAKPDGGNPPPVPVSAASTRPSKTEIRDFYKRSALNQVTDKQRTEFEARLKLPAAS